MGERNGVSFSYEILEIADSAEDEAFGNGNIAFLAKIVAQMLHPYTT